MEDEDNFIKGIFYYEIFFLKYNIYMFSKYNPKSIFFLYGGSTNIINRLQIDINNLNNPLATLTNRRNNYEAALNRVHLILQNKPPHLNVDQLTQNILQDLDHNFNIRNLVNHLIRPSPEDIINSFLAGTWGILAPSTLCAYLAYREFTVLWASSCML